MMIKVLTVHNSKKLSKIQDPETPPIFFGLGAPRSPVRQSSGRALGEVERRMLLASPRQSSPKENCQDFRIRPKLFADTKAQVAVFKKIVII
jgi:hypothetical protein